EREGERETGHGGGSAVGALEDEYYNGETAVGYFFFFQAEDGIRDRAHRIQRSGTGSHRRDGRTRADDVSERQRRASSYPERQTARPGGYQRQAVRAGGRISDHGGSRPARLRVRCHVRRARSSPDARCARQAIESGNR